MKKVNDSPKSILKKDKIVESFFKLLPEKRLVTKISIQEISKLAGINRSTFYTYFNNINDLLKYWANNIYVLLDNIELQANRQSIRNFFQYIFDIIKNDKEKLRNLFLSEDFSFICLKFIRHIRKRIDLISINEKVKFKLHILIDGYFIELITDLKFQLVNKVEDLQANTFEILDKILLEVEN